MYCQICGKQISDTAAFCRFCGAKNVEQVIPEPAPAEESGTVLTAVLEPVSGEPQIPAAEVPEPVSGEPQIPAAEVPEPVSGEPQSPAAEVQEPVPGEPQSPAAEVPEPAFEEPQSPAAEVQEPVPDGPQEPPAVLPESDLPAAEPQPGPSGPEEQADGQPDKKHQRKVKFYMVRTGILTAVVSLLLIPCTAAFLVLLFLNALAERTSFPALGGIERSAVNHFLGSELSFILLGVVCLLLMLDFFFINRKLVRRAFLALGISLLIEGFLSFGLGLAAAYIVSHLVAAWHSILLPAVPAFSQAEVLFGIGWCVIGAALISIYLCIRALRKKPDLVLDRRSKAFPVVILLLHIITAVVVGAGVFLIVSGNLPI